MTDVTQKVLERYRFIDGWKGGQLVRDINGPLVRYTDYEAVESKMKEAVECISWFSDTRFTSSGETPRDCVQVGLYKAREFIKYIEK